MFKTRESVVRRLWAVEQVPKGVLDSGNSFVSKAKQASENRVAEDVFFKRMTRGKCR